MGNYSGYVLIFVLILKTLAVQIHCCSCNCPPKPYWFSPFFTDSNFLHSYLQQHSHHFLPPSPLVMMSEQAPAPAPAQESIKPEEETMEMPSMTSTSTPTPILSMPSMEMYKVEEETNEPPPAPVIFESTEGMSEPEMKMEKEKSETSEPMVLSVDNQIKSEPSHPLSMNHIKDSDGTTEHEKDHHDKNIYYMFQYAVNDEKTHDVKHQKEERKGDVVKGEYSLLEADGNVRTVKYYADWKSGFHAEVHNSKKSAR